MMSEKENLKSFMFYKSYADFFETLTTKEKAELITLMYKYAFGDKLPKVSKKIQNIWILIKPNLDANITNAINGKKGGRPKKETTGLENKKPPVLENKKGALLDIDIDIEKEKDIEKELVKESKVSLCPPTDKLLSLCFELGLTRVNIEKFYKTYEGRKIEVVKMLKHWNDTEFDKSGNHIEDESERKYEVLSRFSTID